jgi:ABC-2 type transport system ATP-binding protein
VASGVTPPRPEDDIVPKASQPSPQDDVGGKGDIPLLKVTDLQKSYDGQPALKGISFELYPGDIMGFLGPNGAGKTTALRILATIIKPSGGSAEIDGKSLDDVDHARKKMGYMPDFIGSYDELTVDEYMEFFARAYLVPQDMREFAKNEALSTTGLEELKDKPVTGLSRGQTQRLALARLLMHDPQILLLDEPAAGLDPRARVQLRDILKELQRKGKAIIVSSHVLEDLTDLSNKIAVLDQGVLLAFGSTKGLLGRLRDSRRWKIRLRDSEEMERLRAFMEERKEVTEVTYHGDHLLVTFAGGEEVTEDIHHTLFQEGFKLLEFAEEDLGLEELYLRITGKNT